MIIALLADTRTGSTAFGNALANNGRIQYFGEVFYPPTSSGVGVLHHLITECSYTEVLSKDFIENKLDDAIRSLESESQSEHIMVDIKYHDLSILPSHPAGLFYPPRLLAYLISRKFWIVHLNRANKLASVVSQVSARITGVHHSFASDPMSEADPLIQEITLDPYTTVSTLLDRVGSFKAVRQWLQDYDRCIDIDYEAVFFSPNGPELISRILCKCLNSTSIQCEPQTINLRSRYKFKISNEDQMRKVFCGTPWELDFCEMASGGRYGLAHTE